MHRKPETDTEIFCIRHHTAMKKFKNGQKFIGYGAHGERVTEQRWYLICAKCYNENLLRRKKRN